MEVYLHVCVMSLQSCIMIMCSSLCNDVSNRLSSNNKPIAGPALEGIRVTQRSHLKRDLISHPALLGKSYFDSLLFFPVANLYSDNTSLHFRLKKILFL